MLDTTISNLESWSRLKNSTDPVDSLVFATELGKPEWITRENLKRFKDGSRLFPDVKSLTLNCLKLEDFDGKSLPRLFGHFPENQTLNIISCDIKPNQLFFLLCMFPKLENLKLDRIDMTKFSKSSRIPSLAARPTLGGKLTLSNLKSEASGMVHLLAKFLSPVAFTDVSVENCDFEAPDSLNDLFIACQEKVKRIKLYSDTTFICELHLCGSFNNTHVSLKYCILDAS